MNGGLGTRWHAAEYNILRGLREFGLPDVFRKMHGYDEASVAEWSWRNRRYDHFFASRHLKTISCQYLHNFRMQGLSDHSPIELDFRDGDTESAANSSQRLGISTAALSYSLEIPRDNHLILPSCDTEPVMNMSNEERIKN
jgi:hypothetical protein